MVVNLLSFRNWLNKTRVKWKKLKRKKSRIENKFHMRNKIKISLNFTVFVSSFLWLGVLEGSLGLIYFSAEVHTR